MPSKQQVIPQNEPRTVKAGRCCDATFGNLPFVPLFAMILSVVGGLLWSGAMGAKPTLDDYHVSWDGAFLGMGLGIVLLLLLHGAVLCHGMAVATLETSRELWHTKDVGCYCGACADPSTTCGQRCRTQQKTCRKACQASWAVLGTTLLIGSYGGLLAAGTVSTTATASSYVFLKSCHTYSAFCGRTVRSGAGIFGPGSIVLGQGRQRDPAVSPSVRVADAPARSVPGHRDGAIAGTAQTTHREELPQKERY